MKNTRGSRRCGNDELIQMSNAARAGAVRAMRAAGSGHLGIALDAADIMTAVYACHLDPAHDRFVLSAGHGSALLYSGLKLSGYDLPALETFRKLGGLPGHPEYGTPGVAATTGPLGQGVANAVGLSFAGKILASRITHNASRIYCLCSDGDLMEGVAQEAIALAGRYKLNNLILLWDDNGISIDGVALTDLDMPMRMRAAGWEVLKANGNKFSEINAAIEKAKKSARPTFIQCKTKIGLGSGLAGKAAAHGLALDDAGLAQLEEKFATENGEELWQGLSTINTERGIGGVDFSETHLIRQVSEKPAPPLLAEANFISTRELSGKYLETLLGKNSRLIGGSADLSESTATLVKGSLEITPDNFNGNFIHYGVREHAMAAIMNGLALGGLRPYGGTFLVFSDYMRGAMRLSSLMGLPVIYVLTHDSIALGEDGPTHQPIEQLAGLRMIPNMAVFRPCNNAEVQWAWDTALAEMTRPSCIVLSRQKFEQIETPAGGEIDRGGYLIYEAADTKITLIATGSEVPLAIEVAKKLGNASVVSMPWVERFRMQSDDYKRKILRGKIIAIEAGSTGGWYEFADAAIGMRRFGKSGAGTDVYKHFGFDAVQIVREISEKLDII